MPICEISGKPVVFDRFTSQWTEERSHDTHVRPCAPVGMVQVYVASTHQTCLREHCSTGWAKWRVGDDLYACAFHLDYAIRMAMQAASVAATRPPR